jgi:hypothetical protein
MLRKVLHRLRILRRPPASLRIASGFAELDGVTYQSFEDFVAALRRIRPKAVRLVPDPKAEYDRVSEVFRAFQVANVGTELGFRGSSLPDSSVSNPQASASANNALEQTRGR